MARLLHCRFFQTNPASLVTSQKSGKFPMLEPQEEYMLAQALSRARGP